jgi:hypothetical protein
MRARARVALLIQHATPMRLIVIRRPSGSTAFFELSHKRHDFREKGIEHKIVFLFSIQLFLRHF